MVKAFKLRQVCFIILKNVIDLNKSSWKDQKRLGDFEHPMFQTRLQIFLEVYINDVYT